MKRLKNIVLTSIISGFIFVGCGSDSGGSSNTSTSQKEEETKEQKGIFVDAPVANLKYTTNSKTGFTDYDGYAEYLSGETCTFYLGDLELGSMTCKAVMSVYEISGDTDINYPSQKTKNIARILQSLDEESSNKDRIVLNAGMKNFSKPSSLDLDTAINDSVMNNIITEANTKKDNNTTYSDIGEEKATANMKKYIEQKHPEKISNGDLSQSGAKPFEIAKILASDAKEDDFFGNSVAVSGNYMVIGAYGADTNGSDAGAAYLFKKNSDSSISQIAKLEASDKETGDQFGYSVSIDGDYIVVGAYGADTNGSDAGAAYLFKKDSNSSISQIAKLEASDKEAGDQFGYSISIDGDYIVVGAWGKDSKKGAAYIFKRDSDTKVSQIAKITADTQANFDNFGYSVSIDGDYIVVGVNAKDSFKGVAYVFKRNSDSDITQIAKIQASDRQFNDNFGYSVSIDGDYIVVGAYREDEGASNAGAAYIFKRNSDSNIVQIAKIQASDKENNDEFGSSVSISGDYIAVGAYNEDTGGSNAGAAYIFKRNSDSNVVQIAKIQASDKEVDDYFGTSVSIDGNNIILGAQGKDTGTSNAGTSYSFSLFPEKKPIFRTKPDGAIKADEGNTNSLFDFKAITPDNETITYTIEGTDASSFSINDSNLSFKTAPDFENPADNGSDNNYSIKVVATDVSNKNTKIDVIVSIQDKVYFEKAKVLASDKQADDNFGNSVAISGDYMVVGARHEDTGGTEAGAAYVFKKDSNSNISQIAKIQASDKQAVDHFGYSVSIDGDYIVVGAKGKVSKTGAAYIFKRNSDSEVTQIAKIQAGDKQANDYFGESVSISGDYIVVGAKGKVSRTGAAYLFKKASDDSNVSQIAKIQASDKGYDDYFGGSVSIDGDYIAIGAYRKDSYEGAAYIFKRNSDSDITQIAKIQASDRQFNDNFGYSVSISGDYIVVGAYKEDTVAPDTGAAYIFKRNSDSDVAQIAKIQASDKEGDDYFGSSISIDGDYIAIGAWGKRTNTGTAYLFKRNSDSNVSQITKIETSGLKFADLFGTSVSIDGSYIAIGSQYEDIGGNNAGAAYLFEKD